MVKIILTLSVFLSLLFLPLSAEPNLKNIEELIAGWQMEEAKQKIDSFEKAPAYIMGLYEFYSGNYKAAENHFKQVSGIYKGWLTHIEKVLPLVSKFKKVETDYFIINYAGKDEIIALYLKEILDNSVRNLMEVLKWKPKEKVILEIYPDRESFQTASTLTDQQIKVSGAIGICKFNRNMIASPKVLKFGYNWPDTVVHEYVHYIIGKITGIKNMPLWLNEGLAKYLEVIWRKNNNNLDPVEVNYLIQARETNKWVAFEKMKHGMPTLETADEVKLAFAQVQSMVEYMVEIYGWKSMRELLYNLKYESSGKSFYKVYCKSVEDLRMEWEEYIRGLDLKFVPGAGGPSYAFNEDPGSALSEWVSDIAVTDVKIADRFRKKGKYKIAIKKYNEALRKEPGNAVILNLLAKAQLQVGNIEAARKIFLRAVKANRSYAPPYFHLGKLLLNENKKEEAEEYMIEYVYISPFNPESHELLKIIYGKLKDKKKTYRENKILNILNRN